MINEADLMQKMEMFIRMNHHPMGPGRYHGKGPARIPFGPQGPAFGPEFRGPEGPRFAPDGCHRPGGPKHMPMHGMPMPPAPGMPAPMHPQRPMLGRERLLVLIGQSEGGIRQKDLLEKVHIGAPAMSELINKLEDDGYIVRTVDPDDRRATLLSLTEKGEARAAEVEDERALRFKSAFAALSDEEKETLSAILDKLLLREA
ncbi:MAG: MarR family transcriptional regulator [Lachnospiraceae bacterium]|nr:MarR family transcriptional regulator [Lachnospiraceae bacterium]